MKIENKNFRASICSLVLPIFTSLTSVAPVNTDPSSPLMLGTIQFPYTVTQMPVPRIYFLGKTIPCEVHHADRKITFDVPKNRWAKECYLLITESIDYTLKTSKLITEMLTIDHIKIPDSQSYKLYHLTITKDEESEDSYHWKISPKMLTDSSRRIPDETIIILYTPEYVAHISGGSLLELPTITMKPDIVALAGSQDALFDQSITLQLASLNSDTIHAPLKHAIKQIGHKTLIAPTA